MGAPLLIKVEPTALYQTAMVGTDAESQWFDLWPWCGDDPDDECPTFAFTDAFPDGVEGVAYTGSSTVSAGLAPYQNWELLSGSIPAGLALSYSGAVATMAGTPTTAGEYTFTLQVMDSLGCLGSREFTVIICGTIALTDAFPDGTVGVAYTGSTVASGSVAPYTYAVTDGAVPTGLTLAADGTLAGTPTVADTFTFTVMATDANGCTGEREIIVDIAMPCPSCTDSTPGAILLTLAGIVPGEATCILQLDCPVPSSAGSAKMTGVLDINGAHELIQSSVCEWRKTLTAYIGNKKTFSDCGCVNELSSVDNIDIILRVLKTAGKTTILCGMYADSLQYGDFFSGEIVSTLCESGSCANKNVALHMPVIPAVNDWDTLAIGGTATITLP